MLGWVAIGSHDAMFGKAIPAAEREQKAKEVAAEHGGNLIAEWCAGRYYVLFVPPGKRSPAAELLAPVAAHAAEQGFSPLGDPVPLADNNVPMRFAARTCYGVAFALDEQGGWGMGGKLGLRFNPNAGLAPTSTGNHDAQPFPADASEPQAPFARARAGWQFLGCALDGDSGWLRLGAADPNRSWGSGPVLLQLFVRPARADELEAADKHWRAIERRRDEKMRLEEVCAICAQYACGQSYCAEYEACLSRRGANRMACQRE